MKNVWQEAIDHELVCAYLGIASEEASIDEARKALSELIQWHIDVATNPDTNGGYKLVKVRY